MDDASTLPSLVQGAGALANDVATLSVTLERAPTAGHGLLLAGAARSGPIESLVGGATTWTQATGSLTHANMEIWYGVADGTTTTITIGFEHPTTMSLWVGEWTGLAPTDTLDDAVASYGETSPASAGTITTTEPDELVLLASNSFLPNAYGVPSDGAWLVLDTRTDFTMPTVWFEIAHTPGSIAPTIEETNHTWNVALAAFRTRPE